jgi:DNA-binding transcriptional MerR regulator
MKNISLPDKLYYSIGEVAAAFGVNVSLIRHWEKEFDILKPKKNKKGDRLFRPEDIQNIRLIYTLVKEKAYTLEGARTALAGNKNIRQQMEVLDRLRYVKEELIKLKTELQVPD